MIKFTLILGLALALSACQPRTTEITQNFKVPTELEDCKVYILETSIKSLYVVRCPNSTVSTHTETGKNQRTHVTLID